MVGQMRIIGLDVFAVVWTRGVGVCFVGAANAPEFVCVVGIRAAVFAEAVGEAFVAWCAAGGVLAVCDRGEVARDVGVQVVGGEEPGE